KAFHFFLASTIKSGLSDGKSEKKESTILYNVVTRIFGVSKKIGSPITFSTEKLFISKISSIARRLNICTCPTGWLPWERADNFPIPIFFSVLASKNIG